MRSGVKSLLELVSWAVRDSERINPLQPYYLVYIRDDGVVRYSFTQVKQILEIFRLLSKDKNAAYPELCKLFSNETQDGSDMSRYTKLLNHAVKNIARKFSSRNIENLRAGREGKLVDEQQQIRGSSDFELISWLVIK